MIGFRRTSTPYTQVNIRGSDIEIVDSFTYLGFHLNNKLNWSHNTKKGQSHLRLLQCEQDSQDFILHCVASALFYAIVWGKQHRQGQEET